MLQTAYRHLPSAVSKFNVRACSGARAALVPAAPLAHVLSRGSVLRGRHGIHWMRAWAAIPPHGPWHEGGATPPTASQPRPHPTLPPQDMVAKKGAGSWVWTSDGRKFLDMNSGG